MEKSTADILSHVPNSGIVQMPGRRFPGIVMQGDSLSTVFDALSVCLNDAKRRKDEDVYFELLGFAEMLQGQLLHYEKTLLEIGLPLPYSESIARRLVRDEFDT